MLSKKSRYAMVALSFLASEYGKGHVSIGMIAAKERIPQRFLEGILLELKNKGILNSTRGKAGGYYLIKDPQEVKLSDVLEIFEGSVSMLACTCESSGSYLPCEFLKDEKSCKIRDTFMEINRRTLEVLENTTIYDLSSR